MAVGTLSTLDFILIFAYFAVLLMIGYFSSRRQKEEDFLIAERKLGTWSTMATMNASKTGSILMIFVALVYLWGFSAVWYFIGAIFGTILFIPFALRLKEHSQSRFYTLGDYFKYNYGKTPAKFASLVTILLMFGFAILNLIAGAKIFVFFTGWAFWICALIMVLIILIYLLLGGFRAVAKTDVLQYIAIVSILFILALLLFKGAIIPTAEWNLFSVNLPTVIAFFLIGIFFPFASPDLWQRVYSSKGKKELRNGLILSILIYVGVAILLSLIALTVKVKFPEIDPDIALIYGFQSLLPAGLLGLSMVLLFSAIMSSLDTYIFTGSSAIIQDFFDWDKRETIKNIKKVIFIFSILATIIVILVQSLVFSTYIFVAFYGALAIPTFATWIHRKIKPLTLTTGFVIGIISIIIFLVSSLIIFGEIVPALAIFAFVGVILGLIIGGIISYFRK